MRLLGFEIKRVEKALMPVSSSRGNWWPWVREPYTGAWQRNDEWSVDSVLAFHAVYACITLISSDIGKLRIKLVENREGIWEETTSPAFSPVLKRPNRFQNHIEFKEWWLASKLIRGNTYALKARDSRGVVTALYILDPSRVTVLVSPDGSIFYRLSQDNLSGIEEGSIEVPASEIIHDKINPLFHPLVGVSPLFAAGMAAQMGLNIETNSSRFFGNNSLPGGILTAPGAISNDTATRLKEAWEANYRGENYGKIAVLGDSLKFEPMRMSAVEAQMIEQLRWTAEVVCSAFHVPPFKIGVGQMPTYQNAEILNQIYYDQALQTHIEKFEACMDEGLGLDTPKEGRQYGVELDLDGLLRMDTATQVKTLTDSINGGLLTTDEARAKVDKPKIPGGDKIWRQQQYYSLEALDQRDKNNPFAKPAPAPTAPPAANDEPEEEVSAEERAYVAEARAVIGLRKALEAA